MQPVSERIAPESTCFVICPIGDENSDTRRRSEGLFRHIVQPAAAANALRAVRADKIARPGVITTQIIKHIIEDAVVVADLTDQNSNVFYELGLRHAFGRPIVQILHVGQNVPFDVGNVRTVFYDLSLEGAHKASAEIADHIRSAMEPDFEVESPVSLVSRFAEVSRTSGPQIERLLQTVLEQVAGLDAAVSDLRKNVWRASDLKEVLPATLRDRMEELFDRYEAELALLQSVKQAGVTGVFKRREAAVTNFSSAIDEEDREIMVVGSSLKGLLQKEEYREIREQLKFKHEAGNVRIKYLLTHPIVADFRATQENRRPTEIGEEILKSLASLRDWGTPAANVRLYVGTPTCFAIKTTRKMLVNPYAYTSVSYDSPCLLLEAGQAGRPSYFFDEFNARHFGAWDTDLAVQVPDFDAVIGRCYELLRGWSEAVDQLIKRGKKFE